jgi:hypothetical protein
VGNVLKYPYIYTEKPDEYFQLDDGHFSKWYFDIRVWQRKPASLDLERLTASQRAEYDDGDINLYQFTFTACINEIDIMASGELVWLRGLIAEHGQHLSESQPYVESISARGRQREAVERSMEWLSGTVGLLNIWDAKDAIDRCRGTR